MRCPDCDNDGFDTGHAVACHAGRTSCKLPNDFDTSISDSHRQAMSEFQQEYGNRPEVQKRRSERMQGDKNPMTNPKTAEKMRKTKTGSKLSDETREKMSQRMIEDWKNNPSQFKPKSSVVDQTGHKISSGWEKEIDIMLHESDLSYEYESTSFKMDTRVYIPDFLVDNNVIEVKGHTWQGGRAAEFIECYPEYTYIVIGTKVSCDIHIPWQKRNRLIRILNEEV